MLRPIVILLASIRIASAAPSPELSPIQIPSATTARSNVGLALKNVCDSIKDADPSKLPPVGTQTATSFDRAVFESFHGVFPDASQRKPLQDELDGVNKKLAALQKIPKKKPEIDALEQRKKDLETQLRPFAKLDAARDGAGALRDLCDAITKTGVFTTTMVATLKAFASAPDTNASLVHVYLTSTEAKAQSDLSGLVPSVSGSLEGYLINGLASFVYSRAKAEALSYLVKQLKKLLCGDTDKKQIFQNVCIAFDDLDTSVSLSGVGSFIAAAARKDVERLPDVLLAYAVAKWTDDTNPKALKCSSKSVCEVLLVGRVGLAFYEEVARGRRPLDVARSLHSITFTTTQLALAPNVILALQRASKLLDATMAQNGWEQAIEDQDVVPFLVIGTLQMFEDAAWPLDATKLNRAGILSRIGELIRRVSEIQARAEAAIRQAQKVVREADSDDAADAVRSAQALFKSEVARAATSALFAVLEVPAVDVGIMIPDELRKLQRVAHLGELLAGGDTPASIALQLSDLFRSLLDPAQAAAASDVLAKVTSVLPIVTQLAQAQSADEVTKVLEASAAPVGSYELKAKKRMVSLTAFAGGMGAYEHVADQDGGWPIGVFAPVGLHATGPVCDGKYGNWGVMLSVINLGNLVSQRLGGDVEDSSEGTTLEAEQSGSLRSVFSPGVFLTKNLAGPFTVGAGMQVVPSARRLTTTTMTTDANGVTVTKEHEEDRAAIQALVFLGVDVTILPF